MRQDPAIHDTSVTVFGGHVYLQSCRQLDAEQHFLKFGDQVFPFEPSAPLAQLLPEGPNLLKYGAAIKPQNLSSASQRDFIAGVNNDPEWSLDGSSTSFVEFQKSQHPVRLDYIQNGSSIIRTGQTALRFSGLFAAHRGQATVFVDSYDDKLTRIDTVEIPVGQNFIGGRDRAGYDEIEIRLPTDPRRRAVGFGMSLAPLALAEGAPHPFIFFAECQISEILDAEGANPNVLFLTPYLDKANATTIKCRMPTRLTWEGAKKTVVHGPELEVDILSRPQASVSISVEGGHLLALSSNATGKFSLYVDDAYLTTLDLKSEVIRMPIPKQYLDGRIHHVMIRDRYGIATVAQDYILCAATMTPADTLLAETGSLAPTYLESAGRHRYDALQRHLRQARQLDGAQLQQLIHAHDVLLRGPDNLAPPLPLVFTPPKRPTVSIVIPAHNQFHHTYCCLCALLLAQNDTSFEVVLVDDGSRDETSGIEDLVSGIKLVRNDRAAGFIDACNKGAAVASGKYIVLLNNDTEPTAGWLDALVAAFGRFRDVGLVGSKLLYPDGTLQDAGGIIWQSGNPWNYGRDQNPWEPRFTYVRQVDFLTGAAMMTPRSLWKKLGGLSTYLKKMYFEDADFACKVRRAGFKTLFVPQSLVFHHEGKTSGKDTSDGAKKYQELNRPIFKKTWASDFIENRLEGVAPDLEKDRGIIGRIAVIDENTPRPDNDAGGHAVLQEMRLMQSLGFKITFLPRNLAYLGKYTDALNALGIETPHAPFTTSLEEFITERGREFDAFYILRYPVAEQVLPKIREEAPDARIIFNGVDLHFLRELRAALNDGSKDALAAAMETRDRELEVIRNADMTLSYNEVEHAVIMSHNLEANGVMKCPWVVEPEARIAPFTKRKGMAFLGGFGHPPNAEAVHFFVENVMPLLKDDLPEAVLSIYGSRMPDDIKALKSDRVDPVGFVKEVSDAYKAARVFVAPLLSGAGLKGKVLGALAHGIPCVLSPIAAEGIGLRSGYDCIIADTPQDWAKAIQRLNDDSTFWSMISENGRDLIASHYSFDVGRATIARALREVGLIDRDGDLPDGLY